MRARAAPLVALVLVAALAAPAIAAPRIPRGCSDPRPRVHRLTIPVKGVPAKGRYVLPSGKPSGLVVFAHGYGHTTASWVKHMRAAARRGYVAVAMEYRGLRIFPDSNDDGLPESRGWPAMTGAEDSLAAARRFQRRCGVETVAIMGVSMGGNTSGLAVALAGERGITRRDGTPLFDYWVDVEGAVNVTETYLAARAAEGANETAARAREDIEEETGGPIEERPQEYLARTVVARTADVRSSGVRGAVVIHGVDDGLVPYNQGREMASALRAVGVPTEMMTVGLKDEQSERETTVTGHVAGQVVSDYRSPLAGHASEKSRTHIVMVTALRRLWDLMAGEAPGPHRECLVNGLPDDLRTLCSP